MADYNYNADERETIITTCDNTKLVNIYTYQRKWINCVLRLAEERPDNVNILKQNEHMVEAEMPVKYLKLRAPRIYTEEEKAIMTERLLKAKGKNDIKVNNVADPEDNVSDGIISESGTEDPEYKDPNEIYLES